MTKLNQHIIRYFDIFPLLDGLESKRPGIRKRVWDFLKDDSDIRFSPINGRILGMNLFFYGVGDEYPIHGVTEKDVEQCKLIHPSAFIEDTTENQLRKDLNLIWYTCDVRGEEIEMFYIMPSW